MNGFFSRRKFLGLAGGAAIAGIAAAKQGGGGSHGSDDSPAEINKPDISADKNAKYPKALVKGSKVAITAPASGTSMGEVSRGAKFFREMGCEVVIGKTISERTFEFQYLSAPDESRAAELMEYITDPTVNCILCARGGYGVLRILPFLDFDMITQNPKIYIGYSDITALINSINAKTGIITFHGPVASSFYNEFSRKSIRGILFENPKFEPVSISNKKAETVVPGMARGRLAGGNLSLMVSLLGTPYDIDTRGCILLLEDSFTEPYIIDRMITQLWLAGKLQACSGIAIGNFQGIDARRSFYPGRSYTIREVLQMRLKQLNLPSVIDLPFGHSKDNVTLPIGAMAQLDTETKSLIILEKPAS